MATTETTRMRIRTLAEFLREKGLKEQFEKSIAPYLHYLRLVLGPACFTGDNPPSEGPRGGRFCTPSLSSCPISWDRPFGVLHHSEEGIYRSFWESMDQKKLGGQVDYNTQVDCYNLGRIRHHLFDLEGRLLGSLPRGSNRQNAVAPVYHGDLVPFSALLGEGRVNHGKGGIAGGYDYHTTPGGYCTPVYGEDRRLPVDDFNKKISEVTRALQEKESKILAGNPLMGSLTNPGSLSWGAHDDERFYDKYPGQVLCPPIFFTTLMPDNAVYIISPREIVLLATDLCTVTTDKDDSRIVSLFSRVHHSLLHDAEFRNREKHHAAFLAVNP